MPMITVHSLPVEDKTRITPMLQEICVEGGRVLGRPTKALKSFYVEIAPGHYVEGDVEAPAPGSHPPVVVVRMYKGRTFEMKQAFATVIAAAVSRGLAVPPENVWIHFDDMDPADLYKEGKLGL